MPPPPPPPFASHRARGRALVRSAMLGCTAITVLASSISWVRRPEGPAPRLDVVRYSLPNGLRVVLHEDHSAPIVTVDVWYLVGSRDEEPGRVGLAHLFEHLMSEGSANVEPGEHRRIVQAGGGVFNASTSEDRTNYHQTAPRAYLETLLWLEGDRMATLPARLDTARIRVQRAVIREERAARVENVPFGVANEATLSLMLPEGHPYRSIPLAAPDDPGPDAVEVARRFFERHYAPSNAVLVVAGDFRPDDARRMIARQFGGIPGRPRVERRPATMDRLAAERRAVLEGRSATASIRFAWPTVGVRHRDVAALTVLAGVLGGDPGALLQQALMHDRPLATSVTASQFDLEEGGVFQISVTPRAEVSLTEIERVVDSVVASVRAGGVPDAQVARVVRGRSVAALRGLQSTHAKAELLAEGEAFHGDPNALLAANDRIANVAPRDVAEAAAAYLTAGRVVLSMVPVGRTELASRPGLPFVNVTPRAP